MSSFDLSTATTLRTLDEIHRGGISSLELLEQMIANIERMNPEVNAVVAMDLERARAEAVAADDLYASGGQRGPLHGLPMTVKDCYQTIGLETTAGAPELANFVPEVDADLVRLLRRAGAIVWAKTNVPLYAGDHQTYNDVYGVTQQPLGHHQDPQVVRRAVRRLRSPAVSPPPRSAATSATRSASPHQTTASSVSRPPTGFFPAVAIFLVPLERSG